MLNLETAGYTVMFSKTVKLIRQESRIMKSIL